MAPDRREYSFRPSSSHVRIYIYIYIYNFAIKITKLYIIKMLFKVHIYTIVNNLLIMKTAYTHALLYSIKISKYIKISK